MCMYMCFVSVCAYYARINICIYMCVFVRGCVGVCAWICVSVYVFVCICTRVCVCVWRGGGGGECCLWDVELGRGENINYVDQTRQYKETFICPSIMCLLA